MWQILLQNATAVLLQNTAEVYYKMRQVFITKYVGFITKCDSYYKMQRLLQIVTAQTTFSSPFLIEKPFKFSLDS